MQKVMRVQSFLLRGFSVKVDLVKDGDGVGRKWGWFWTSVGMSFGSHLQWEMCGSRGGYKKLGRL
jgi:hypothetical protein